MAAALRILALEDDLAAERALTARLRARLAGQPGADQSTGSCYPGRQVSLSVVARLPPPSCRL